MPRSNDHRTTRGTEPLCDVSTQFLVMTKHSPSRVLANDHPYGPLDEVFAKILVAK